jgi:sugar-specific transcriptional regulator TrmB
MDEGALEKLGLTRAEIKVYLTLLGLGNATAGPVISETGLQNSVVHLTLHRLVEKGYASFITEGKTKHYQAADPRNMLKFIDENRKAIEAIVPELMLRQKGKERQEAEVFSGFRGLKSMLYEAIEDAKSGDEYLFFSLYAENTEGVEEVFNFYREFEKERARRGIVVRGIAPASLKSKFKGRDLKNIAFVDFPIPTNISVINDKVIMTPLGDKKISFLIHSRQLAGSFRSYFYSIWNQHKRGA